MNKKNREENEVEIDFSEGLNPKKGIKKSNKKSKKNRFKSLPKWEKALIIIISILLVIALILGGVLIYVMSGLHGEELKQENLGISADISDKYGKSEIKNIVVFGVDTRNDNNFKGNSDVIMIVSVDKKKNTVKLSSILRDSYVAIDGKSNQKITHAYGYGGAELAVKTLNKNFNMDITDYVTLNFGKLSEAIDMLGGVDLEITESERFQINSISNDDGRKVPLVKKSGNVHLTGQQAVTFARLREADSDVVRSSRQKKVIDALIVQAKLVNPIKYPELVNKMITLCETSLTTTEILSFAPMMTSGFTISTLTIPGEPEKAIGGIYEGYWVWRYDLKAAAERLHQFIYEDAPVTETTVPTTAKAKK
ncbi:MAG: LCP family protein [Oscillospiraceae bacterium]